MSRSERQVPDELGPRRPSPLRLPEGLSRRRLLALAGALGSGALVTACRRGVILEDLSQLDRLEDRELAAEIARQATAAAGPSPAPEPSATAMPVPSPRDFGFDSDLRLTPADRFYVMKYGELQELDAEAWRLSIDGLAPRPLELGLREVEALPARTVMRTLACISNPAGGHLIGNGVWTGVGFADLLALAGVDAALEAAAIADTGSGLQLRLESADGYHTGVSLALALDPDSLLVTRMNGRPLLPKHGFPARCLFPGRFGQKQPKWITRITLQRERHIGHWEAQGWSDRAEIVISSRIDAPANRASAAAPVSISGIAFAGLSGVEAVELVLDERQTVQAELRKAPAPLADLCWTEWSYRWPDPPPGRHSVLARARDGAGRRQRRPREHVLDETFPDGSTTMHRLVFHVPGAGA